ncbi:DUF2029 domain-containing protein [Trebonia kvetii]|uniref:DUF2029 domain-containing protein n=1 Tax=Trebonia kvetii TaxID=2480626 RepID=A0A6P2BYF5_9ACTN|nr:glycosyltransferase 87 family protein [Trebonia kvetii]TVZ03246.1 DUF2029 domain-containing protein [Trebonia kvetii]
MGYGVISMLLGGGRRRAVLYGGFALYAAGVALFSGPGLDHWWGTWAAGGYAIAAAITAWGRPWSGRAAVAVSVAGALIGPAIWLMTQEPTPPDVAVVARSGVLLLHHGSPYLPLSGLTGWLDYNPYLPVMALFGLPGALGLPGKTWPWLIAATFLLLYATFRVTLRPGMPRRGRAAFGYAAFWLACPVMAFPLTMGITDPPVIALTCLGLALLARGTGAREGRGWEAGGFTGRELAGRGLTGRGLAGRGWNRDFAAAALVLGVACAMKYTAWPALVIVAVMVAARDGWRAAVRFTAVVLAAAAALVAALAPAALGNPASLLRNTVDYPLGLTGATSPAASPLPGHLLATLGSGGHLAALLLLAAAGIAIAASLVVAPPATPAAAARRVAIGLTALFLLAPATRFGYFIYPISLYAWAMLADRQRGTGPRDSGDQWSLGRVTGRLPARYERRLHRVIGHSDGWDARQMPDPVT